MADSLVDMLQLLMAQGGQHRLGDMSNVNPAPLASLGSLSPPSIGLSQVNTSSSDVSNAGAGAGQDQPTAGMNVNYPQVGTTSTTQPTSTTSTTQPTTQLPDINV